MPGENTRVELDEILTLSNLPLEPEDHAVIVEADRGCAVAQCDLALLFLTSQRPTDAVHWFALAAKQSYPDAMCFLGRCHIAGEGVPRDVDAGIMWLRQAAAKGHYLAKYMLRLLISRIGRQLVDDDPAALEVALDDIERRALLSVLAETANPN